MPGFPVPHHLLEVAQEISRRNINNRYADGTTLMAESEEELKSLLTRLKEESEKASLNLNIKKKTKIMASCPIISWQIEVEKVEAMKDFLLLGSKFTADCDCSHINGNSKMVNARMNVFLEQKV